MKLLITGWGAIVALMLSLTLLYGFYWLVRDSKDQS
jgi:hypothetical protein